MDEEVVIRLAELRDAEIIATFSMKMAQETEGLRLEKSVVTEGVQAVLKDPKKGFYLVAEDKKKKTIVGQLAIVYEWSDWSNKQFWLMQGVYVDEDYRRKKIFSRLYRSLIEIAHQRGDVAGLRLFIEKHNESAKKVYRSLGIKESTHEVGEIEFASN
jgi:GNAT superfamily N-acetyltransferase